MCVCVCGGGGSANLDCKEQELMLLCRLVWVLLFMAPSAWKRKRSLSYVKREPRSDCVYGQFEQGLSVRGDILQFSKRAVEVLLGLRDCGD